MALHFGGLVTFPIPPALYLALERIQSQTRDNRLVAEPAYVRVTPNGDTFEMTLITDETQDAALQEIQNDTPALMDWCLALLHRLRPNRGHQANPIHQQGLKEPISDAFYTALLNSQVKVRTGNDPAQVVTPDIAGVFSATPQPENLSVAS